MSFSILNYKAYHFIISLFLSVKRRSACTNGNPSLRPSRLAPLLNTFRIILYTAGRGGIWPWVLIRAPRTPDVEVIHVDSYNDSYQSRQNIINHDQERPLPQELIHENNCYLYERSLSEFWLLEYGSDWGFK